MVDKLDITGEIYGKWTVLEPDTSLGKSTRWLCRCECGKEKSVIMSLLRTGRSKSCGCSKTGSIKDQRFGRLLALSPVGESLNGSSLWICRCDCGSESQFTMKQLKSGSRKSCGCLPKGRRPKNATGSVYNGVRQFGHMWQAYHPAMQQRTGSDVIATAGTEHEAACAVREWLLVNTEYQEFWPLSKYPMRNTQI